MTANKELLGRLEDESIDKVKFSRGWILLEYDGKKLVNHIIVESHQQFVGRWDVDLNAVYVDNDLKGIEGVGWTKRSVPINQSVRAAIHNRIEGVGWAKRSVPINQTLTSCKP